MFLPPLLTYYGLLSLSNRAVRSFAIAGLLGPILSGFIMTGVTEGGPGVSRLLRRIVLWRVGFRWYLFALIGLPAVVVLATITGASLAAGEKRVLGWRPPAWWPVGVVACARILNSFRRHKGYSSEGYRPRLRRVRLGAHGPAPNYYLGGQQHEKQRVHGYIDARLLEHLLCCEPDSAFPNSDRARQLLEPHCSRVDIGVSSHCGDARTNGLPGRSRHAVRGDRHAATIRKARSRLHRLIRSA